MGKPNCVSYQWRQPGQGEFEQLWVGVTFLLRPLDVGLLLRDISLWAPNSYVKFSTYSSFALSTAKKGWAFTFACLAALGNCAAPQGAGWSLGRSLLMEPLIASPTFPWAPTLDIVSIRQPSWTKPWARWPAQPKVCTPRTDTLCGIFPKHDVDVIFPRLLIPESRRLHVAHPQPAGPCDLPDCSQRDTY